MNIYTIRRNDTDSHYRTILADSWDEAKRAMAMQIYDDLLSGEFGDEYIYVAEEEDSWYDEPGVYSVNYSPPKLILPDSQLMYGIEEFAEDTSKYYLATEPVLIEEDTL